MQWPIINMYLNEAQRLKSQVETSTELVPVDGGVSEEAFALQPGIKIENQENQNSTKMIPSLGFLQGFPQDAGNIAPSNLRMIPSF